MRCRQGLSLWFVRGNRGGVEFPSLLDGMYDNVARRFIRVMDPHAIKQNRPLDLAPKQTMGP